ncbi:integrase [Pseudoduganella danionis]|uniref:integrase n=1 Tax=Pseudoduganella danionis TaxID=1890295 RepID=UPI0035AEDA8A
MKAAIQQGQETGQSDRKKIHELTSEELGRYHVSEHSQFNDEVWFLINPTPGAKRTTSTLNWRMTLLDGSRLIDVRHIVRLHWAKILVLTLLVQPSDGCKPSPGSMSAFQSQLKWLLSWMSHEGYHHPHELKHTVIQHYIDQLPEFIAVHSDDGEVGVGTATRALTTLMQLWGQRQVLARMGVVSLTSHPFEGRGAHTVATGVATKAMGWLRPLPDEVAIPMLNKAAWFLGTPAIDVLRMLDVVRDPLAGTKVIVKRSMGTKLAVCSAGIKKSARTRRAREFLDGFEFSTPPGGSQPWHEPLDPAYEGGSSWQAARMARVRVLWEAVRDSAAIIVQATSGMRVSELLGILAGTDEVTGLPRGVRLELSATGLYEWFVIRSQLAKTEEGLPREVDWVLGMRPVGTNETPLAVQALQILDQLYKPWRACARTDRLILAGRNGATLPVASMRLGAMSNDKANEMMKRFIRRWINLAGLPDESARKTENNDLVRWRESNGSVFCTHMLRKAWAQFALACDPRLLPAIQMQFHHISLAMTEGGYIGRNPLLLDELDSMSTQKTNLVVFDIIVGKSKLAGRMGEQLEQALAKLRAEAGDLPTSEKWRQAVEWSERNDLKMFFTAHATCCPTRTSEMRCHDASNTPIWLRKAPNTATREPSVCAGCACAIMDKSHEPFWSDRYVGCEVSVRQAEAAGAHSGPFREIRFRADQARGILKKFGADLDALDARVVVIMENGYAQT